MLFIVLYRVVLIFESVDEIVQWFRLLSLWTKSKKVSNQMKAIEHYFFFYGAVYYAVQRGSYNF